MLRALPLPAGADEPGVKATYKSGILEVRVPIHEEHKPAVTHVAVTGD
jgi:HSP20 family molecular chaperone IbpA